MIDIKCIAIVGTGDMGSAVGRVLIERGYRLITDLSGRSTNSRELAESAGFELVPDLMEILKQSDLVLSIMPPAAAIGFARRVADKARDVNSRAIFADCNAVSPHTSRAIAEIITQAGLSYLDVGIIGHAPGKGEKEPRFYVSGKDHEVLQQLNRKGISIISLGEETGKASAMKMVYASLTKGTNALRTAVLLAANVLDVAEALHKELEYSQASVYKSMQDRVPFLAADAERWAGEMKEIADTYEAVGITPEFHKAAEWLFGLLAESPLSHETRNTMNHERSLEEALTIFTHTLQNKKTF